MAARGTLGNASNLAREKGKGRQGVKRGYYQTKFKAKGKGKGSKRRGNLFGRYGKSMCFFVPVQITFRKSARIIQTTKGKALT